MALYENDHQMLWFEHPSLKRSSFEMGAMVNEEFIQQRLGVLT